MSTGRVPVREYYDAIVDLTMTNGMGTGAYAIVKFTYDVSGPVARIVPADPLFHDVRDESLKPRVLPGTDYWSRKNFTDFAVRGSAYAPGGRAVESMTVTASIGRTSKSVAVFGKRLIHWYENGTPAVGNPEPFIEMPMTYENAYGGVDVRVPVDRELGMYDLIAIATGSSHPGLYPRNGVGKGYIVTPAVGAYGLEMPNLEAPWDRLTPERLVVRTPQEWYAQPFPWCFDWVSVLTFPRKLFFGLNTDAWYPGPEDERMPEVALGYLPKNYRQLIAHEHEYAIHPRFYQEGSTGFVLSEVADNETITIEGMHPERSSQAFMLPGRRPEIQFFIEGKWLRATPRLHSIEVLPAEQKMHMVYGADVELPRYFLPGVHKNIPVGVSIEREAPIMYAAPLAPLSSGLSSPL